MKCISLCAWHSLFVHFVSQHIHALSHSYISQLEFFQKSSSPFYGDLFMFFFDCYIAALLQYNYKYFFKIIFEFIAFAVSASFYYVPLSMHLRLIHHPSTCTDKRHPTASGCPLDLPRRKALGLCHIYAQNQVQNAHYTPENFLATAWWLFQAKHISC